jgi:manganese oxidase
MAEGNQGGSIRASMYFRSAAAGALIASLSLTVVVLWLLDPANVPKGAADFLYRNIGERPFEKPPATAAAPAILSETPCSDEHADWRPAQVIDGVPVREERSCEPHNPYEVAAFVKGTNNISEETLKRTALSKDTVEKCCGDDPRDVSIRLEVTELNGRSPDLAEPLPRFDVAPGISPTLWVFSPKARGMSTENFETLKAASMLRAPSPTIRVRVGDHVKLVLENSHYLPHTIHLHGVDHPFETSAGQGNDGVPGVSEMAVEPGKSRTYEFSPREPGTFMYHCHVQTHAHFMMGLVGMLIVEPYQANSPVQTLNVGAGFVRAPSKAVSASDNREYDLVYSDIEPEMHGLARQSNDPRVISEKMHQEYRPSEHKPDIFLVNGRSFPYTLREAMVIVKPDEHVRLHVLNAGSSVRTIHTHGHKVTITEVDGGKKPEAARFPQEILALATGERMEAELSTVNDGLHSYGQGAWLIHDHVEEGQNRGIDPGGDVSIIAYEKYLTSTGLPKLAGDPSVYFTKAYYEGKLPTFGALNAHKLLTAPEARISSTWRLLLIAALPLLTGMAIGSLLALTLSFRLGRTGRRAAKDGASVAAPAE